MSFVLSMAWRESRASQRRMALLVASIAVGVAALARVLGAGDGTVTETAQFGDRLRIVVPVRNDEGGGIVGAVVLSRSSDGGNTWSTPVRVSPPASGQACGSNCSSERACATRWRGSASAAACSRKQSRNACSMRQPGSTL